MKPLNVLIMEDDLVSIEFLDEILSGYGQVDIAESGKDALHAFHMAHARSQPYDLITLDIGMPDISGNEVLDKIREWEYTKGFVGQEEEVKIIMVTAEKRMKERIRSLRKGCEEFISKPIEKEKIASTLLKLGLID
ncbi:MAG: response regulator [SAR324 cluster bacterium]|nr:response regulator [SAR324 cluster bacterium]